MMLVRLVVVYISAWQRTLYCRADDHDAEFDPLPEVSFEARDPFLEDEVAQSDGAWLAAYATLHSKILSAQVPLAQVSLVQCGPAQVPPLQRNRPQVCARCIQPLPKRTTQLQHLVKMPGLKQRA